MLPDAGNVTELFVVILQTRRAQPPLPVYIDDVTFGPLEQDVYEYNQNGWTTKNGKLDALHYDPHAALPVDIRSGNRSTHFRYGGRGQRVLKTTVDNEQNLLLGQRLYIHGANAYPLTEITSYGETIYIYGHGGVVAVCENGQPPSFLLKDHLGSTRVVVDQKNQPIAIFHYLPFGSLLPDNGNSPEAVKRFRYLYTGQEYDEEIGLYNYRARLYDSDLGRFLTPDPKRQFPSPYVYVNNNPLNFTDPTGEMFRLFRRGMKAPRAVPRGARGMKYGVFNNYKVQVAETVEDAQQLLSNKKNLAATGTSANRIPQIEYNSEAFQAAREPQALDSSKVITREQDPYRYDPEHPLKYSNLNGSSFGTGTSAISVDMSVPRAFGDEVLLLRLTKELPEMQFSELGQGFARYTVEELFEGGYVIATIPKGLIARRAAKGSALVRTAWGEWVPRHQSLRE